MLGIFFFRSSVSRAANPSIFARVVCSVGDVWGDASNINIELYVSDGDDDINSVLFVWVCGWKLLFFKAVKVTIFGFMVDGVR